jgi:PBSX family phage terminase large subunit
MLKWTLKQKEYLENADKRWNFKVGAVRSGKTFQDKEDMIARRIRERIGKDGLCVLMGVTKSTLERNVLRPMRDKFGDKLVGNINNENKVMLFGEECYALGAEKINQVSKIQGASFKYVYGDEVAKWSKEVFDMVKSRLDQDCSCFDGTCNPEGETHWLKEFLDSDIDVYIQHYVIDDNDFLSKTFKENLKKEYFGTVLYDRYILGLWVNAEGIIYKKFANDPDRYGIDYVSELKNGRWFDNLPKGETNIGIDYGGTRSGQAFVCTRISDDFTKVIAMASYKTMEELDSKQLLDKQIEFIEYCRNKFHCEIDNIYPDNEETVHIRSLQRAVQEKGWRTIVRGSKKEKVNDRIELQNKLLAFDVYRYIKGECDTLNKAMKTAMWNSKKVEDERLDDFTTDIDSMDSYEYSIERRMKQLINMINYEN